jgi:hypothetical protein
MPGRQPTGQLQLGLDGRPEDPFVRLRPDEAVRWRDRRCPYHLIPLDEHGRCIVGDWLEGDDGHDGHAG